MHQFVQAVITWYFDKVLDQFGLLGVVILMAMESSIFPVPSELVVPPAAVVHIRDLSRDAAIVNVILVILAGTLGSLIGASVTYYASRVLGRPNVVKYGKYFLVPEKKLKEADEWMVQYGAWGIFIARLLPVVRHVISIPAGIIGMRFRTFALMTTVGSFIWCTVLAIFGVVMTKPMLSLIEHRGAEMSPEAEAALQTLTFGTIGLVGVATVCYILLSRRRKPVGSVVPASSHTPIADAEG